MYLTKFTFWKSRIWHNSHFQNLLVDKIHTFKISYLFRIWEITFTIASPKVVHTYNSSIEKSRRLRHISLAHSYHHASANFEQRRGYFFAVFSFWVVLHEEEEVVVVAVSFSLLVASRTRMWNLTALQAALVATRKWTWLLASATNCCAAAAHKNSDINWRVKAKKEANYLPRQKTAR